MNAAAYLLATGQASATALECGAERLSYGELRAAVGQAAGACDEALEINGDGSMDISDAVYLLGHLFTGGSPPPAPYPSCGNDPEGALCPDSRCNK